VSLLSIERLQVAYGGIRAVKGIDLAVEPGELVCLIGANGAGKTTTLRAITGIVHAASGAVRYDGIDIARMKPHEIARRGLAMVPEGRGVFAQLTIEENLAMGAYARKDRAAVAADADRAFTLFPRLKERRKQTAGTLSGGEQQMLAVARALMARPRLLLLDEPSLGLAPQIVKVIFNIIEEINKEGVTILLVEQNAHMALSIAHRGYVLETGEIKMSDDAKKLAASDEVRKAYLGVG